MSNEQKPILLVKSGGDAAVAEWRAEFARCAPELEVRGWSDEAVEAHRVQLALVADSCAIRIYA